MEKSLLLKLVEINQICIIVTFLVDLALQEFPFGTLINLKGIITIQVWRNITRFRNLSLFAYESLKAVCKIPG